MFYRNACSTINANIVDPNLQTPRSVVPDMGLHYLPITFGVSRLKLTVSSVSFQVDFIINKLFIFYQKFSERYQTAFLI